MSPALSWHDACIAIPMDTNPAITQSTLRPEPDSAATRSAVATPTSARALSVRALTHSYGGGTAAVEDVSFDVPAGEIAALLGPSGCGKSTVLRAIAGLIRPNRGTIALGTADLTVLSARARGIGMVFQNYALFPHLTVAENIAYPLACQRVARPKRRARVAELLGTDPPRRFRQPPAARVVGWAAAARRRRTRTRVPPVAAAARRAVRRTRPGPALRPAGRDAAPAEIARHHHADRHPRSGGSAEPGDAAGPHEPGAGRADRQPDRGLRPSEDLSSTASSDKRAKFQAPSNPRPAATPPSGSRPATPFSWGAISTSSPVRPWSSPAGPKTFASWRHQGRPRWKRA